MSNVVAALPCYANHRLSPWKDINQLITLQCITKGKKLLKQDYQILPPSKNDIPLSF